MLFMTGHSWVRAVCIRMMVEVYCSSLTSPDIGVTVQFARPLRKERPPYRANDYPSSPESPLHQRSPRLDGLYEDNYRGHKRYVVVVDNLHPRTCWQVPTFTLLSHGLVSLCAQELKDFGRLLGGDVAFCDIGPRDQG